MSPYTRPGTGRQNRDVLSHRSAEHCLQRVTYEDPAQTLTLSKLRSIKLIEDVPFQNMPVLHPDEKASEENEFGPLSNDDICITSDSPIRLT